MPVKVSEMQTRMSRVLGGEEAPMQSHSKGLDVIPVARRRLWSIINGE